MSKKLQALLITIRVVAVLWFVLGVTGYFRYTDGREQWLLLNSFAMIVTGIIAFAFAYVIPKKKWSFYPAIIFFILITLLSIADEIGVYDIIMGVLNLAVVVMLIISKKDIENGVEGKTT